MASARAETSSSLRPPAWSRSSGAVLELDGLVKRYGDKIALDRAGFSVFDNEYVSVLGPSGAGKTVLLRVIAGFEEPEDGSIHFRGARIDGVPPHRRGIGFVFQNFALFPHLNVFDNIAYGLANRAQDRVADRTALRRRAGDIIKLVGLGGLEGRGIHQISGGQRQRVALARTLVAEPRLVLLDEPLGALDANLRTRMRGELRRIRSQLGITFLHVTGSETEALAMGDRVVVLDRGRIRQFDTPETTYNQPVSPEVARILNCYNLFSGHLAGASFHAPEGDLPVARVGAASGTPAYAIRRDLIAIEPAGTASSRDTAALEAAFVTSEYSGSAIMYFFELPGGKIVEVEHHLSHRAPETLEPRRNYSLVWRADDAVVFG